MKSIISIAAISRIVLVAALIFLTIVINAQNIAINTNGANADNSAMLDVSSTSKGFLAPRMTTVQRTGISTPANGLLVFDTDTKTYWYFSITWKEITNGGGASFTLPYIGSNADPNKVFSITNTGFSSSRVAIHGKGSNVFTGLIAGNPIGVWGEEDQGFGVSGTSIGSRGVYGYSQNNIGVYGKSGGTSGAAGAGGYFENSNSGAGLYATSNLGLAAKFEIQNPANNYPVVVIATKGSNAGVHITSDSADFPGQNLINGLQRGTGGGLSISLTNENTVGNGAELYNYGSGDGVRAFSKKGYAGFFYTNNASNNNPALYASTSGSGSSASFAIINNSNSSPALAVSTSGTGAALSANVSNPNPVNSIASFKRNGFNVARIDGTGKGFFNGGTQNSGADLAEAFDVTGNRKDYEAGDVLIIAVDKDRAVEKSSAPYSTLVAGVYATKPGVLLTEEDIETNIADKVPMGVVGVIPTKVCLEGGEIKRGDLLVTSSIPGVAMKADIEKIKPGQVIGKALANFNSSTIGKIKVLVNVK